MLISVFGLCFGVVGCVMCQFVCGLFGFEFLVLVF